MTALPSPFVCVITDESLSLDALDATVAQACTPVLSQSAGSPARSAAAGSPGRSAAAGLPARSAAAGSPVLPTIQLRARSWSGAALFAGAERLRATTRARGCALVVNDRIDVALAVEADGVHLPAAGIASVRAREIVGRARMLGRSVHSLDEIDRERDAGALDYVQFGPVFATASKARYGTPQGLGKLADAVVRAAPLAVVAVGGITALNAHAVASTGAAGIAVIGAIMRARDPAHAIRDLVTAWHAPTK